MTEHPEDRLIRLAEAATTHSPECLATDAPWCSWPCEANVALLVNLPAALPPSTVILLARVVAEARRLAPFLPLFGFDDDRVILLRRAIIEAENSAADEEGRVHVKFGGGGEWWSDFVAGLHGLPRSLAALDAAQEENRP